MISISAFGFTGIPTSEKDAKQFARDLVVLLNGGAESATLIARSRPGIVVRRIGPDAFLSKNARYHGWAPPGENDLLHTHEEYERARVVLHTAGQLAEQALKFANASAEPQAKVVAALKKHLPREDTLF